MAGEERRRAQVYTGAFIACIVLSLLSIAFVDRPVSIWAHTLNRPAPLEWLTHIIDPFVPAASIALLGIAVATVLGWRLGPLGRIIIALCLAVLIATVIKEELKFLFGRTWPETWVGNNPSWIHDGVYRFEPLHGGKGWAAFPSGHMAIITAPCTVLWIGLILAVAIGLIASDYHFVGDMIAGTFVGWACGIGAVALTRGLVTPPEVPERAPP
jgi:membrane-associated phospholipid phosphatase